MTEIPWARKVYAAVIAKLEHWPERHRSMAKETMQGLIRHYEAQRDPEDQILPTPVVPELDAKEADD
jgi:hypothetical protein